MVEQPAYDLLTNNPYIDEIILFDKPKFRSFSGLWQNAPEFIRLLRSRHFDLTIDLQALFKSAAIAYLSGARKRLVYCNARELSGVISRRVCGENSEGHVVERYLDVVRALGCEVNKAEFPLTITEKEELSAKRLADRAGLNINRPYVVLIPGTNWPNKCWSPTYFGILAEKIYRNGIMPVIIGGAREKPLAEAIRSKMVAEPVDLCGLTSLKESAYLFRQAKAIVGGDTGPMHLAAALGRPVVAMYGPTDIKRNGPYGPHHKVLQTSLPCAGCWKRQCPKGLECLETIKPEEVYEALQGLFDDD